jgi:hypothetical protein
MLLKDKVAADHRRRRPQRPGLRHRPHDGRAGARVVILDLARADPAGAAAQLGSGTWAWWPT